MFHFGFSYIGFIYLLMLFIPNIIWTKNQPKDYEKYVVNESKFLQIIEKIGQVLVCCLVLIFSDFNVRFNSIWSLWLLLSFVLMLLYEVYWVRYFKSEKNMSDFYRSILGIPVAGATLPVCSFFLLGVYGSNIFLIVATIILGIGHIGIHRRHYKEISEGKKKRNIFLCIIKWVIAAIFIVIFSVIIFFIGCRNFTYINNFINTDKGVEEGIYVSLGGQEQYLLIRGENVENPVIIYLHGGPASPDSSFSYAFTNYLVDENLNTLMQLSRYSSMYHENPPKQEDVTWNYITSPYLGVDDVRWQLMSFGGIDSLYHLNKQLYDYILEASVYDYKREYQMPVYFISGSHDWTCPANITQMYYDDIRAPKKDMTILEGCGHNPQAGSPKELSEKVKEFLK